MTVQRFGFFSQDSPSSLEYLRTQTRSSPDEDQGKILEYLNGGTKLLIIMGVDIDLLSCDSKTIGTPPAILTDGEWLWTSDVAYYVEQYHLSIPPEFKMHMRANRWKCPRVDESVRLSLIESFNQA